MKIAHVVEAWAGGIATYVSNLINYQVERGYDVTLIADLSQLELDERELNVAVIGYNSGRSPWAVYKSCRQVMAILDESMFDVVHAHSTFPGIYTRMLNSANANIIYTPHAWCFIKGDIGVAKSMFYKFVERRLTSVSRKIICMSYDEIEEGLKAGIATNKMVLLHTGIPEQVSVTGDFSVQDCTDSDVINVGFFGRLDYQKGYDSLIKATEFLSENVVLHIYGGAVRSVGVPGPVGFSKSRVIHHGWIPSSKLNEALSAIDVVVIPSRWEGFALAPLEAMRAGRGIVVSNMSSLPEVVINGFNGIVLKDISARGIADALNSITRSDCAKFSKNARLVYEQTFRQDLFMRKMDGFYYE